ncbi:PAS domain S-box-containing protein [Actinomadura cellulosilytica]|uniref:histidine kinase n=1 Tax=Thermomonospora cellulosilytica TaxID=1411118 RepID=A0A7W3N080_9ACTN|nr:PAS domain S-box-containing protein [Thermomonospora cellulosilytica]
MGDENSTHVPRPAVPAPRRDPAGDPAAGPARDLADDLPDGLLVAGADARVVLFNRAASRLTGIPAEEALGRDFRDVLPLHDAEGRDWWKCLDPYGGLATRTRHPERSLYLNDGTELLVTAAYRRGPRGAVERFTVSFRDAAWRARRERDRADLVSTVAHELRSPLTSVKGFTATLLAKWHRFNDDQKRVMLETVNADADRVTRLITELLDVSRIEAGRLEMHRQVVDLAEEARKVIAGRVAAGDPEDRFRLEVRGELPEMWLDPDKIDQILGNLLENAVRHGAGTVTVVVEPDAHKEGAAVSVRDEGEGIPPEAAQRVFRQFWRGPGGNRRGGTGLGLFIVKGLVEAHGGTIAVQRAPGGGAEFRFTLPAGAPDYA